MLTLNLLNWTLSLAVLMAAVEASGSGGGGGEEPDEAVVIKPPGVRRGRKKRFLNACQECRVNRIKCRRPKSNDPCRRCVVWMSQADALMMQCGFTLPEAESSPLII